MNRIALSLTLAIGVFLLKGQDIKVLSGPMLGYADMREAVVWLQLKEKSAVQIEYWDVGSPEKHYFSETVGTSPATGNTAKLYLRNLEPDRTYAYNVLVDGDLQSFDYELDFKTEPQWDYRRQPPHFKIALGSCLYINESAYDRPGKPYGGEYQILESILDKEPEAMLWLGDNIYLRPADWWSRSGYLARYTHTRKLPELQELLASCNNYAIWDDHDFGPNDASGSWVHRDLALEMFKLFWANPTYGYRDMPSTFSAFNFRDCDFVMLDNRFYRTETSDNHQEQMFGKKQIDRTIDLLKQSRAPFKFVLAGSQILNTAKVYENFSNFEEERTYFLERLELEGLNNVIFLTGDRHHSEVMKMEFANGNAVYEFTVSPLTSGANSRVNEDNQFRVEGSLIQDRNFATIEISGDRKERSLLLEFFDSDGNLLYQYRLNE